MIYHIYENSFTLFMRLQTLLSNKKIDMFLKKSNEAYEFCYMSLVFNQHKTLKPQAKEKDGLSFLHLLTYSFYIVFDNRFFGSLFQCIIVRLEILKILIHSYTVKSSSKAISDYFILQLPNYNF